MLMQLRSIIGLVLLSVLAGCMQYEPPVGEQILRERGGVWIVSEGNFNYGNATLNYYAPRSKHTEERIFSRVNSRALGDVAQSLTMHSGKLYVVVNNSGVVYILNAETLRLEAGIKGLTSPRYIHFISDEKAYITDLYASGITVVNPQTRQKTGFISLPKYNSTEQMVAYQNEVWVSCWSYGSTLIAIDTHTDDVSGEIEVGIQPKDLLIDYKGRLWTLCTGGYPGSPGGYEAPSLWCMNAATREVIQRFNFNLGEDMGNIALSPDGKTIYYVRSGALYCMSTEAKVLPKSPLIPRPLRTSKPYGLGIDPKNGDIYIADAIDYVQRGAVYRYSTSGIALDTFRVGINPSSFYFEPQL